MIFITLAK